MCPNLYRAGVAQLVEQALRKRWVGSSSLSAGTNSGPQVPPSFALLGLFLSGVVRPFGQMRRVQMRVPAHHLFARPPAELLKDECGGAVLCVPRGPGVPEVVEAESLEPDLLDGQAPLLPDEAILRRDRPALVREDVPIVLAFYGPQNRQCFRSERHRERLLVLAPERRDPDVLPLEVDLLPFEGNDGRAA